MVAELEIAMPLVAKPCGCAQFAVTAIPFLYPQSASPRTLGHYRPVSSLFEVHIF
jgi:hypothetical protein